MIHSIKTNRQSKAKVTQRIRRAAFAFAVALQSFANAGAVQHAPGLLPTEIARPILDADPAVRAARAQQEMAEAQAQALDGSPYDWTVRSTAQRRSLQNSVRYQEWNVGIEHGMRLPAKSAADRRLGKITVDAADAAYGEALHEAARTLAKLWVEWLAAEQALALSQHNLASFQKSLVAVETRERAGDAAKLDVTIVSTELIEQRRVVNDAATAALSAWTLLAGQFPGLIRAPTPLPMPLAIAADVSAWRTRILRQSDELKLAEFDALSANARAERARAERMPDPTLGVYAASELGGREDIIGISISIPIPWPGGARSAHAQAATAHARAAVLIAEAQKRALTADVDSAFVLAKGAYHSLELAQESAAATLANAKMLQRAYTLGETGLQELLIARRQATSASNTALKAQTTALLAYYRLIIDAHWVWSLEHEQ